jgi:hypothetical protein
VAREVLAVTTASEGAGKWTADLNEHFAGRIVWIIPDADKIGRDHAVQIAANLAPVAAEVRILDLPTSEEPGIVVLDTAQGRLEILSIAEGDDVFDFLEAGGTGNDLLRLGKLMPIWKPEPKAKANGGGEASAGTGSARTPRFDWRNIRVNAKDIRTMSFNPISFLVPGLIPNEGITLICAKPKVGKSWLLLDIAIASTADRFVLGEIKPVQGDVLYLALEDSLRRLQTRLTKLLPTFDGEWPEGLTFATEWRRVDQGGLDDIRDWAKTTRAAGRKIAFIAIDVLKMIRPPSKSGQPAYEADYEAIKGLHQLAIELGVPIIIVHHTRKAEAEDLIDKVSGTFGLSGAADTIIIIEHQSQGTVFDVRGRDVEANSLAVQFSKETCRWTILGSAAGVHRSSERASILAAFEETNAPMTAKDVTDALACDTPPRHMSQVATRQILARMAKNGDLERLERGKYRLPTGDKSHSHKVTSEERL